VTPRSARILGGVAGVLIALSWLLWQATRPAPCSGAVFVEFGPPLTTPGPYRFTLTLDREAPCSFQVALPPVGVVDTSACALALDLTVRGDAKAATITALTVGASPSTLQLRVERGEEVVYDTTLKPQYAEYAARREDDPRFCGQRAHVEPACVRGSSQCVPYRPACRGPSDCPRRQVCCISPDQALEYGVGAAARCISRDSCETSYGALACRSDDDCPNERSCDDERFEPDFEPSVTTCRTR
jgi:hypothetical protein